MNIRKKSSRGSKIKKLHGALKGLLMDKSLAGDKYDDANNSLPEILPAVTHSEKKEHSSTAQTETVQMQNAVTVNENTGIMYIMSRENHLIPKLTDDQIMERHKQADENMKQVWTSIISKYESIEDQGDILDLQTGEVIEDNGHIRGLSHGVKSHDSNTRYTSTLKDILQIDDEQKDDEYSIWEDEEEDSDGEYIQEETEDSEEAEQAEVQGAERYTYLSKRKQARRTH